MKTEYLLFNMFVAVFSTVATWLYPYSEKIDLKSAFKAITIVATPFILIDFVVTDWFWSFNLKYVTGIRIGSLPIEEILFFFTVPWACLLIWINLKNYGQKELNLQVFSWVGKVTMALLSAYAVHQNRWYTLSIALALFGFSWLVQWMRIKQIHLVFAVLVSLLTLIFNMYLTARPLVVYNPATISNVRVGTIPIEDFLFGLILVLSVVAIYEQQTRAQDIPPRYDRK